MVPAVAARGGSAGRTSLAEVDMARRPSFDRLGRFAVREIDGPLSSGNVMKAWSSGGR